MDFQEDLEFDQSAQCLFEAMQLYHSDGIFASDSQWEVEAVLLATQH